MLVDNLGIQRCINVIFDRIKIEECLILCLNTARIFRKVLQIVNFIAFWVSYRTMISSIFVPLLLLKQIRLHKFDQFSLILVQKDLAHEFWNAELLYDFEQINLMIQLSNALLVNFSLLVFPSSAAHVTTRRTTESSAKTLV